MNGRNGEEIDYVTNDSLNPYLLVPDDFTPDTQSTKRKSQDKYIKGHGKSLIEFCKSSGLRIANGRIGSDKDLGQFTCLGKKATV